MSAQSSLIVSSFVLNREQRGIDHVVSFGCGHNNPSWNEKIMEKEMAVLKGTNRFGLKILEVFLKK